MVEFPHKDITGELKPAGDYWLTHGYDCNDKPADGNTKLYSGHSSEAVFLLNTVVGQETLDRIPVVSTLFSARA
jgi:hypothetical protein